MKVLFITHSGNLTYGAAKSMGLILKHTSFEYDVMFQKTLRCDYTDSEIKNYAGEKCENIYFADLPLEYSIMSDYSLWRGEKSFLENIRSIFSKIYRRFLFQHNKNYIYKIIEKNHYDAVYLNSSILYPLINVDNYYVIHIRELLKNKLKSSVINKLCMAKQTICIDSATAEHLYKGRKELKNNNTIITNPFDMTGIEKINCNLICDQIGVDKDSLIYLVAGIITEAKGVEYIIQEFTNANKENTTLLIVGNKDTAYAQALIKKYKKCQNVIFLGEVKDMIPLYAVSDYLIRGENEFCTGRTVFEALFSGKCVILPGKDTDRNNEAFSHENKKNIFFYEPRQLHALEKLIKNSRRKCRQINSKSNVDEFIIRFEGVFKND